MTLPAGSATASGTTQTTRAASAHLPAGQPLHVRVLGTPMVVLGLPNVLRARLAELLQPFLLAQDASAKPAEPPMFAFAVEFDSATRLWNILGDGVFLNGLSTDEMLLQQLEWRIISAGLEHMAGCGVFHAGVLARGGATVLIQGNSGAGKTTVTLGLIARGWLPLADDAAIVDAQTLGVQIFPRCFHVEPPRNRPAGARPRLRRITAMVGHARPLRWAEADRQPTAILTIARDPGQPSSLVPIMRAEAAGALLQGAIRSQLTRSEVAALAARIASTVQFCGHLNNGDLTHALDLIEAACAL